MIHRYYQLLNYYPPHPTLTLLPFLSIPPESFHHFFPPFWEVTRHSTFHVTTPPSFSVVFSLNLSTIFPFDLHLHYLHHWTFCLDDPHPLLYPTPSCTPTPSYTPIFITYLRLYKSTVWRRLKVFYPETWRYFSVWFIELSSLNPLPNPIC